MKVLWTFDPFQENKELVHFGKNLIKGLFKKDQVGAVYVASHAENELNNAFNITKEDRYTKYPKELMQKELKKLGLSNVEPHVLTKDTISLSAIVKEVVNFSAQTQTDLLLIASNARKTLPRLIYGSFAETLIHQASTDLLVFHQKTDCNFKAPKKILLAHDFSPKSQKGLERALFYAKEWGAKLVITHIEVPLKSGETENYQKELEKKIKKLSALIHAKGVQFEIKLFNDFELIEDTILRVAKKEKADVIAVTAHSSKFEILLGGSTTRRVLRSSKVPILVLKSK